MTEITEVKGIGPATAVKLHGAGIRSAEALANAEVDHLVGIIGRTTAKKIIKNAQDLLEELGVSEAEIKEVIEESTTVDETVEDEEPEEVEADVESIPEGDLTAIEGIGPKTQSDLIAAGFTTPNHLAKATVKELTSVEGVGKKTAESLIENAQKLLGTFVEKEEEEPELETVGDEDLDELVEDVEEDYEDDVQDYDDDFEVEYDEDGVRTRHERSPTPQGIPTRKKGGVQISSDYEKIDLDELDVETAEEKSGWKVKAKKLTEEEKEARRLRQEMLRQAEKITREIPEPPKPVKAKKSDKKSKSEKPVKKEKKKSTVQQKVRKTKEQKKQEMFVDYYSNQELHPREKPARPKVNGKSSGKSEPRIELDRDTYLGRITSKRRSRRNINNRQVIVDLVDGLDGDMLVGQKVYFNYPNGNKISGSISRRFGKKSTGKVLVNFKKGIREEGIFMKLYKY